MLEAKLKTAYKSGELKGIFEIDTCFYMPVRITGSGLNLRKKDGETIIADRNKLDFFDPDFIDHCKSLPIIINHPKDSEGNGDTLNAKNIGKNAIIGNVIDAWINDESPNELWGLARIFDKTLIEKINSGEINSTSPSVIIDYDGDESAIIQNEKPIELNHLAFCERGHWDVGGSRGFDDSQHVIVSDSENSTKEKEMANSENLDVKATEVKDEVKDVKANDEVKPDEKVEKEADKKADDSCSDPKCPEYDGDKKDEKDEAKANDEKANDVWRSSQMKEHSQKATDECEAKANDAAESLEQSASRMAKASHAGLPIKKVNDEMVIDECETIDDRLRDAELKRMRVICDSADTNLNVKMPFIAGRQTFRSVAHKFITSNKQFLNSKYANLTLDSYTPELAREVLDDVYSRIGEKAPKQVAKQELGFVDNGSGLMVKKDF